MFVHYSLHGSAAVEAAQKTVAAPRGVAELDSGASLSDLLNILGVEWPEGRGSVIVGGEVVTDKGRVLNPGDHVVVFGLIEGG